MQLNLSARVVTFALLLSFFPSPLALHARPAKAVRPRLSQTPTPLAPPTTPGELAPRIDARGVMLMDPITGQILFSRAENKPFLPASTVKLMTALLVYEKTRLAGAVRVEPVDTYVEPSSIPLRTGEVVRVSDLTYALLLGSDNDAAMALARHVSGSVGQFVDLMNARARELGCTGTRFVNPNGLPAPGQYTTAADLLKIFQKFISYPLLRKIAGTQYYQLSTQAKRQRLKNHNRLLGVYPGMGPAKTGWTVLARHTYAAAATRDGRELLLVLLQSKNKWIDAPQLFDYGFARLAEKSALGPAAASETQVVPHPLGSNPALGGAPAPPPGPAVRSPL